MQFSQKVFSEIQRLSKELVRETILLPSQNFASRVKRPDDEILVRIQGKWKINILAIYGMRLLIEEQEPETQSISFWKVFSDTIEHLSTYSLVQQAKGNILLLDELLVQENIEFENIFGNTPEEIFGFLRDPATKQQLFEYYRLYLHRPRKPMRVQRHRGYRDHGSLGGDKEFLKSRNLEKDTRLQLIREEYAKYRYSHSELERLIQSK